MFRRLSAWHILTAGLLGISVAACGNGGREDASSQGQVAQVMPPSVAAKGPELTSVKPAVTPTEPAVAAPEVEEPPAPVVKTDDEVLDRMVFDAERKPSDVRLRVKVARALFDAGKIGEARTHAERAIEVEEKSAAAWHLLGRIEMAELDFAAAATSFQRAVEEEPDNSYAWNNLGYALIEQKNFEEAAAALEHATSGTSPTGYMWNNLGMAYEHLDRIREARAAYRQAAEAGSTKGQANLERLEGVTSLRPSIEAAQVETVGESAAVTTDETGSVGGPTDDPQEEEPGC